MRDERNKKGIYETCPPKEEKEMSIPSEHVKWQWESAAKYADYDTKTSKLLERAYLDHKTSVCIGGVYCLISLCNHAM